MSTQKSSENIKAGLFVVVVIAVALAIIFTLGGVKEMFVSKTQYIVRFELHEGAKGLEVGSDVTLGGRSIGAVQEIEFGQDNSVPTYVDITIAIDSDIQLYQDAVGFLERPLLGAGAVINFTAV